MKYLLVLTLLLTGCEILDIQDSRQNRSSNECILIAPDGTVMESRTSVERDTNTADGRTKVTKP